MRRLTLVGVGIGLGVLASPAYLLMGLLPGQAVIASLLAAAGSCAALLIGHREDEPPRLVARPDQESGYMQTALTDIARIRKAARSIEDANGVASLLKIANAADEGARTISEKGILDAASRKVFAYYLPETVKLAMTLKQLQDLRHSRPAERAAIVSMLKRLEDVFYRFADDTLGPPNDKIARDLALLEQSISIDKTTA